MEKMKIEMKARKMYSKCEHGECPICIDSTSGCPVIDFCSKPCMEVKLNDWIAWMKSEEVWSHPTAVL